MNSRVFAFVARAAACLCLMCALAAPSLASNVGGGPGDHPAPRADLTITQVTKVYNRLNGQLIPNKAWIQIINQGNASTGYFEMFVEWGMGYSNQMMYFVYLQGLAPGQSVWAQVDTQGYNLWTGNFLAFVDSGKNVVESDETNNVYEHYGP